MDIVAAVAAVITVEVTMVVAVMDMDIMVMAGKVLLWCLSQSSFCL